VKSEAPALLVTETFYSLQGESSWAGHPCFFIRLAGCNLRCAYCDARYTYEEPGVSRPLAELLAEAAALPSSIPVEITGGEPLLQGNVYPLMNGLLEQGRTVLLETNGSLSLARVPAEVICVMDVKCPGSGMADHFDPANLGRLTPRDEIKFVLSNRADYEWARDFLRQSQPPFGGLIHFSPVIATLPPADLAAWIIADRLPIRLQLQLHTLLWPDRRRGC